MKSYHIAAFIWPILYALWEWVSGWWEKRKIAKGGDHYTVASVAPPPLLVHDRTGGDTTSRSDLG